MKNSWYKKAKLADKIRDPRESIFLRCMYCKKFLTDPEGIFDDTSRKNPENWKSPEEMDAEELKSWQIATRSGFRDSIGISDGICPVCHIRLDKEIDEYRMQNP